jgi:hypothetical protein
MSLPFDGLTSSPVTLAYRRRFWRVGRTNVAV